MLLTDFSSFNRLLESYIKANWEEQANPDVNTWEQGEDQSPPLVLSSLTAVSVQNSLEFPRAC